ncbi:MAG: 50S ribosome-binding GTPase [Planctomycetes bacterium]|nr:50S ribosome-binding GTPase [Planctomycetota bacterium]
MPANLTPEYMKAEQAYKEAKDPEEKLAALKEMLSKIPKHKGTDHMQGEIKRKIAQIKKDIEQGKGQGKRGPSYKIPREGAGQIVIVGPPNAGKSSLVAALTRAEPAVADYPFTTRAPQPGMMPFEDIAFQLVDTPPITMDFMPPWMNEIVRSADAALLVADLGSDAVLEDLEACLARLADAKVELVRAQARGEDAHSPTRHLQTILAGNKLDAPGAADRWAILTDLYRDRFESLAMSARTREGLDALGPTIFRLLDIIRVYTKAPGKKADLAAPFVLPRGSAVIDVARAVHKEIADRLQSARIWGSALFDGQHVKRDHIVQDRDIVEFHHH